MMSLTFGLFTQVSGSGPLGPLVGINEVMVQILLMLEVLFTQDSKVEDLFCGAFSGSEPSLFFSNYFFSLGFQPIQDDFQHDFARMTDEADSSVVWQSCKLPFLGSVIISD